MRIATDQSGCDVALSSPMGQAYNEEAFSYFLAIEARRAARSGRPLFVLLVELSESAPIGPAVAAKLFAGLWASLRESDFGGWQHDGRVAAAALTEFTGDPGGEAGRRLMERIERALAARLPSRVASGLRLRVHRPSESRAARVAATGA